MNLFRGHIPRKKITVQFPVITSLCRTLQFVETANDMRFNKLGYAIGDVELHREFELGPGGDPCCGVDASEPNWRDKLSKLVQKYKVQEDESVIIGSCWLCIVSERR
jgi:hypothetical protein